MRRLYLIILILAVSGCGEKKEEQSVLETKYNRLETEFIYLNKSLKKEKQKIQNLNLKLKKLKAQNKKFLERQS